MRIYYVEEKPGHEGAYWPTKREAMLHARWVADSTGDIVEVEEIRTVNITTRKLCEILGGWGGYAESQTVICKVKPLKEDA